MGEPSAPGARVTPSLSLRGIGKSFHGVTVLEGVDLDVAAGEVHAVVGENGAGKSTLMKIVAGVYVPSERRARARRRRARLLRTPVRLGAAGVEHRLPGAQPAPRAHALRRTSTSVSSGRTAADSIARRWSGAPRPRLHAARRTRRRDATDAGRKIFPLRQQQVVEIARALMANARIVDLRRADGGADRGRKPTSCSLAFANCSAAGIAIVYVSHRLPEVFALSDRITVLKDGRRVATVATKADQPRPDRVDDGRPRAVQLLPRARARRRRAAPVRLRVAGGANATLHDIDLELRAGRDRRACRSRRLGTHRAGPSDVRRRAVHVGRRRARREAGPDSLATRRRAARHRRSSPRTARPKAWCSAPMPRRTACSRCVGSARGDVASAWEVPTPTTESSGLLIQLELRTRSARQTVGLLSGGNQQKVVLAKWLAPGPARPHPRRADPRRGRGGQGRNLRPHGREFGGAGSRPSDDL